MDQSSTKVLFLTVLRDLDQVIDPSCAGGINERQQPVSASVLPVKKIQQRLARRAEAPSFLFRAVPTPVLEEMQAGSGIRHKVVTVIAPVGYGKTVFMASFCAYLQNAGETCFWAALDEWDTSIERLLGLLEVMAYGPDIGLHPTQALMRGDEFPESRTAGLILAAVEFGSPCTVFIDNLNYCTDAELGPFLDKLVFKTPDSMRFVLSSTAELPLGLARAKLAGRVRQIGYRELSLGAAEVATLLGSELCEAIGSAGVEVVMRQTEGWPAAVRMAQIILSAADRPQEALAKFSGSDEDIAALLNQQVLSGFPVAVRDFLMGIAQLRTFCGELCRYATGSEAAEQYLALLLRRNVFVIPLDRNRSWYRLHGLFREYLLSESRQGLAPERRRAVLQRAAEWCERGGHWRDAIDYALAAEDMGMAAKLLERTAQAFVGDRGDLKQYIEWVETLHSRGLRLDWEAEYWYAWALVLNRRYDLGRQQNERLAEWVRLSRGKEDPARLEEFQRRVDIISACVGIFTDHLAEAYRNASHWLVQGKAEDPFNATAANCTKTIYYLSAFKLREARLAIQAAQGAAFQIKGAYTDGWIAVLDGLITLFGGDCAAVYSDLLTALGAARRALGENAGICGTIALVAARAAVEIGLDQEAEKLLVPGLHLSKFHGFVDAAASGVEAAIKLWAGREGDPISLRELRDFVACYPPRLAFMFDCYLIQRLIRLGRLDEASIEAARIGLNGEDMDEPMQLPGWADVARCRDLFVATEIDLCIAGGRHRRAELLIAEEIRLAKADCRSARLVELALARAVLAAQARQMAAANRHLTQAVTLAAPRGIVRPFRDQAKAIASLVEDTKPSAWGFALEKERKFFAEICRMLPISNPFFQERLVALNMESQLLETLTARQMELLGLLAAGLSNQQLADRINVTVTTVKGHLQKLYAKLGVSSRAAALARARVLNLVP